MSHETPSLSLHGNTLRILFQRYANGRICMRLVDELGPYACATVNVPEATFNEGEALIRDWSENKGVLSALTDGGVVEDTGLEVPTGCATANVVRLKVAIPEFEA